MEITPKVDSIWIEKVSGIDEISKNSKDISVRFLSNTKISVLAKEKDNMKIFDLSGRNIFSKKLSGEEDTFDISTLSSGKYIIKIYRNGRESFTKDFTIIK
uniref:T9SS type A sorting domain-containing protein n=1 Tax=candidate division WOR-3 bacterium TaxID=2052148 RepID=A0A7C3N6P7_UNCW3